MTSNTGLFIAPLVPGPEIKAGGRYLDSRGGEWRATETAVRFADGPYVCCIGPHGAAAYFRASDGAPFGHPSAPRLVAESGEVYATSDADGPGCPIRAGATILAFESEAAALASLIAGYADDPSWDLSEAHLEPGEWGDCWHKFRREPDPACDRFEPFAWAQINVLRPGQHPGGREWWITPYPAVLILAGVKPRARTYAQSGDYKPAHAGER